MKKFENPAIEVINVMVEDVIATSGNDGSANTENDLPDQEIPL